MSCIKRLQKELKQLHKNPLPGIHAEPSASTLREWHFVILGDKDSVYSGGVYHGTISFPVDYPFSPPTGIRMRTPNGRFIPNEKICLSITSYHPESWSPLWNMSTILLGFQSFFYCQDKNAIGVMRGTTEHDIRRLAAQSMKFNKKDGQFCSLFPYLLSLDGTRTSTKRKATETRTSAKPHKKNKCDSNNNNSNDSVNSDEIVYISDEVIDLTSD